MVTKAELHQLIDELPEDATDAAGRLLTELRDPVLRSLLTAAEEDEPLTAEELAGLEEARAERARGEGRSLAQVCADLARRRG